MRRIKQLIKLFLHLLNHNGVNTKTLIKYKTERKMFNRLVCNIYKDFESEISENERKLTSFDNVKKISINCDDLIMRFNFYNYDIKIIGRLLPNDIGTLSTLISIGGDFQPVNSLKINISFGRNVTIDFAQQQTRNKVFLGVESQEIFTTINVFPPDYLRQLEAYITTI